jgi:BMFP domain-containing protein YqiC
VTLGLRTTDLLARIEDLEARLADPGGSPTEA